MNNSNGKASLKRQKSPETKTDIVFLLCARVGWCDVCTDFTNVIKVDDVNNSNGGLAWIGREQYDLCMRL